MSRDVEAPKSRPFPWKCVRCGQRTIIPEEMDYTTEINHDGRPYQVNVPALRTPRCQNAACRAILLDADANRRITQAFRRAANLLEPEEIRQHREALGLTQAALAERLDVGPATVSRWETGSQIQQRSLDKLLRLYFNSPEVRRVLEPVSCRRFRCLKPTQETHCRARRFRLPFPHCSTAGDERREPTDDRAEMAAGHPIAE